MSRDRHSDPTLKLFKFEPAIGCYRKVAKIADTQTSAFTCHGQSLAKTVVREYSKLGWDTENASA
jgi:hypothetical protein